MRFTPMPLRAFTLIELLVIVALIAIFAALLVPGFASTKDRARAATCLSQMRQVEVASAIYAQDHSGVFVMLAQSRLPAPDTNTMQPPDSYIWWPEKLRRYARDSAVFDCPGQRGLNGIGINHAALAVWGSGQVHLEEVRKPDSTIAFADVEPGSGGPTNSLGGEPASARLEPSMRSGAARQIFLRTPHSCIARCQGGGPAERHGQRLNVTFVDGHGEMMRTQDIGLQYPNGHAQALWDKQ